MVEDWHTTKSDFVLDSLKDTRRRIKGENLSSLEKYNILVEVKILTTFLNDLSDEVLLTIYAEMKQLLTYCD